MSPDVILHHYAGSPFSEKVRLVFGFKALAWRSVVVPVMLPKPDVIALTGGYRRTPFLQVGADIYCDSALMCRVLEQRAPTPTLYPRATAGQAEILAQWADSALFWSAVSYTLQPVGAAHLFAGAPAEMLKAFRDDRAAMTVGMRRPTPVDAEAHLSVHLGRLEQQLADGREWLLGAEPCIADVAVAHPLWFIRRAPPLAAVLEPHRRLAAWYERVQRFGQGSATELSSGAAIDIAARAPGHAETEVQPGLGFERDTVVSVAPLDYAPDPVTGRLVGLTADEVVVARKDARAGRVHVHFPRVGFTVRPAE